MTLYQAQPDRSLRAKALAKEYGTGGHSHDFLDGSRGFVNHDWKGLEFDHYPDHQKITLKWTQVEKYIDLMIQSDRYLTDKEKEHYTPPVSAKPDADLTCAKKLIREFCQEEYDSAPDFSDLSKIGIAYTNATDEEIPIQVNVDLVGYRVERYLGEVLIDERQYESLEDLTETELEALDFSELVSVTDEELEHYHSKAEERPALLPLDAATEYNALKEQHPDALVGFEQNGQFEFYADDAQKVCELLGGKLLEKETALGTVPVTGFPRDQWVYRAKQLWQCGENVYLAGLNEDGTHHQTKYLRREDYLPLGAIVHMEGSSFRVETVNFDKGSVTLQDVALAEMRMPVFRQEPLAVVRELYEQEQDIPQLSDEELDELPISAVMDGKVQTFPDAAALDEALNAEPMPEPAGNFHITDDHLGEGGAKQKYARNIEAIRTLFKLEEEHRGATAEEQQVLSQYVGWGGLADAFDPNKENWSAEYTQLKELLSEDEYAAARASTLNAHYTSPTVIRGIYDAVERMGFQSGNILEPSMGVGNFFGMLPTSMADSRLYGVELDSITGRIAKKLYPQADITVAGRPPTAVIFMTSLSATCPLVNTESTTRRTTNLVLASTIISLQKPSTRCGPAALWHLSPAVIRWTVRILLPGSILRSVRICWEQSACQTTHSAPMRALMLSVTSSFCRNATAPLTMSRTGCSWAKQKMALPSTSISQTTRRWFWAYSPPKAPSMDERN